MNEQRPPSTITHSKGVVLLCFIDSVPLKI